MKIGLFFLMLVCAQKNYAQAKKVDTTNLIFRDTTLIMAKEHCSGNPTTCWFGDNVHLNRMIIYNGNFFWKNYPLMLFHFLGLDLRNYQEKANVDYRYLDKVESLLQGDLNNDSNVVILEYTKNKHFARADTAQFKLYKVTFKYAYIKKSKEFMPNFFNLKLAASYAYYPANIYYIVDIKSLYPFNELSVTQRRLTQ